MKIFDKPNLGHNWKCPICKKNTESQVTLIPVNGTEIEPGSNTVQALQVHVECLDLAVFNLPDKRKLIFMSYEEGDEE